MKKGMKRWLSLMMVLVILMSAAMLAGCTGSEDGADSGDVVTKAFVFTVVDVDGSETTFDIESEKQYVGEALIDEELIAGEEGQYGLYVKTVNGITYDYDTDGKYWAFYINGEYAPTGVDVTEIEENAFYSFRAEK